MTTAAVEQLLYLMDHAFEEYGEHSLLRNLASVPEDAWLLTPPGGSRSVRQVVGHVGACKHLYDDVAFRDARMTWEDPAGTLGCTIEELQSGGHMGSREPAMSEVIDWLQTGQNRLRAHVAALDDGDLQESRRRPEGGVKKTLWIITVLIEHDVYHAGEINHIRALMQGNDRWAWDVGNS